MKYYSQYRTHDLFELQQSLSGLSKSNRWVKLADNLPWDKIEKEYNKRLREQNDVHLEDKKRAVGERNEVEAAFGTSKRVYRANNIRAKLDETADTWIGACFFAKNVMKFLRGLLRLIFGILGQKPFMGQLYNNEVCLVPVCDRHRQWHILINQRILFHHTVKQNYKKRRKITSIISIFL